MVKKQITEKNITITPPNFQHAVFTIEGTAPLVQNGMSEEMRKKIKEGQEEGDTTKKHKKREPKNFQQLYQQAKHISREGWCGVNANAFRIGMVTACKLCNIFMTIAKLAIFIKADGYDIGSGVPLIRIIKGEPHYSEHNVKVARGAMDLRSRPMWDEGWQMRLIIDFDADQFKINEITYLLDRVGKQVGIGEGRPDSPNSCGMGWGTFRILGKEKKK